MLQVTSTLRVLDDQVDTALALAQEHVARSLREDGCLRHDVFQSPTDPRVLFFFERWRDQAALDRHFQVPESGGFVRDLAALLAEPPKLEICTVTDERSRALA